MPPHGRATLGRGVLREPVALARGLSLGRGVLRPALSLVLFVGLGLSLVGCSETRGDADYATAEKSFEKEMTADQRRAAIQDLQKHPQSNE
jgi:hypothetical protein